MSSRYRCPLNKIVLLAYRYILNTDKHIFYICKPIHIKHKNTTYIYITYHKEKKIVYDLH